MFVGRGGFHLFISVEIGNIVIGSVKMADPSVDGDVSGVEMWGWRAGGVWGSRCHLKIDRGG